MCRIVTHTKKCEDASLMISQLVYRFTLLLTLCYWTAERRSPGQPYYPLPDGGPLWLWCSGARRPGVQWRWHYWHPRWRWGSTAQSETSNHCFCLQFELMLHSWVICLDAKSINFLFVSLLRSFVVNQEWLEGHCAGSIGIFPGCFAYRENNNITTSSEIL